MTKLPTVRALILFWSLFLLPIGSRAATPPDRPFNIAARTALWGLVASPVIVGVSTLATKGGILLPLGAAGLTIPAYALSAAATAVVIVPLLSRLPGIVGQEKAKQFAFFAGTIPTIQTCAIMLYTIARHSHS